jgi:hypothetical protein
MGAAYLIPVALAVPAATFTALWFWCLRPGRRGHPDADAPPSEADLAGAIYARQQQLRSQVTDAWEARERSLAAQVADLIELTGAQAKITLPGPGAARLPENPENPEQPGRPEQPENPEQPGKPEQRE